MPSAPINLFISYARTDVAYLKEFSKFLVTLKRQNIVNPWIDSALMAGDDWNDEIRKALEEARIVVFLVSQDFIASDYIYEVELKRAMERHEAGEIIIIPVVVKSCDFSQLPISKFQALPQNAKPVEKWEHQEEAWMSVVKGIRRVIESLPDKGTASKKDKSKPSVATEDRSTNTQQVSLKSLVAQGNQQEVFTLLLEKTTSNSSLHNEVFLLSTRHFSAQKNQRQGLVSNSETTIELNKINLALLELIDQYEAK